MAKDKSDITCDIVEQYGYLNLENNKVMAKVSWNDNEPKYDIRKCYTDKKTGELKLAGGISLTEPELQEVVRLYQSQKKREVNFDKIVSVTSSIVGNRNTGHVTKDGFIRLTKKAR